MYRSSPFLRLGSGVLALALTLSLTPAAWLTASATTQSTEATEESVIVTSLETSAPEAEDSTEDYELPDPQTEDDPQYWTEYYKYHQEDSALTVELSDVADDDDQVSVFSMMRSLSTTFTYTSPFYARTYTIQGDESALANGVDVSYYQDTIDWEKAKADGVEFAFIRAAFRGHGSYGNLVTDTQLYNNLKNAAAAGVKIGVYIYSQAISVEEAQEEANYVLDLLQGYSLDLPIVFDQEFAEGASGAFTGRLYNAYCQLSTDADRIQFMTDLANAFCDTISEAGFVPAVYASTAHYNYRMNLGQINGSIWVAQYAATVNLNGSYDFWQYTSSGSVAGIPGKVDCNFCVTSDYNIKESDSTTTSPTTPSTPSEDTIVIGNTISNPLITISPTRYPSGTVDVSDVVLAGFITGRSTLESVSAIIYKNGVEVQNVSDTASGTGYTLSGSKLVSQLRFNALESGKYQLAFSAQDINGVSQTWVSPVFVLVNDNPVIELPEETPEPSTEPTPEETTEPTPEETPDATPEETPEPTPEATPDPTPEESPEPTPEETQEPSPQETPDTIVIPDVPSEITISPVNYPTGDCAATSYTLTGTIQSALPLDTVTVSLYLADGTLVTTVSDQPEAGTYTYSLENSALDNEMSFSTLEGAFYYLTYSATDCKEGTESWSSPVFAIAPSTLFTDVQDPTVWYYSYAYRAASRGFITGFADGDKYAFQPQTAMTRAQIVVMLYQIAGAPAVEEGATHPFTDATASWYQTALTWAYQNQVVAGTGANTFSPNQPVTREQTATILCSYVKGTIPEADYLANYTDGSQVSTWAVSGVRWCIANGIMSSMSTTELTYAPKKATSRAEAATILNGFIDKFVQ